MSVFSDRLRLVMNERGMTQAELCALTGIPKSAMTQYIHASFRPKQNRTDLLCRALNVSPAWIMGLTDTRSAYGVITTELTVDEDRLVRAYREHPELRSEFLRVVDMTQSPKVFRAAKSKDGRVAPSVENRSSEWIQRISDAPETDEEL